MKHLKTIYINEINLLLKIDFPFSKMNRIFKTSGHLNFVLEIFLSTVISY